MTPRWLVNWQLTDTPDRGMAPCFSQRTATNGQGLIQVNEYGITSGHRRTQVKRLKRLTWTKARDSNTVRQIVAGQPRFGYCARSRHVICIMVGLDWRLVFSVTVTSHTSWRRLFLAPKKLFPPPKSATKGRQLCVKRQCEGKAGHESLCGRVWRMSRLYYFLLISLLW